LSQSEKKLGKRVGCFVLFTIVVTLVGPSSFDLIPIGEFSEKYPCGRWAGIGFFLFLFATPAFVFGRSEPNGSFAKNLKTTSARSLPKAAMASSIFSSAKSLLHVEKRVRLPLAEKPDDERLAFYENESNVYPSFLLPISE